jgi:ATP-dependent Lhr-like helicase
MHLIFSTPGYPELFKTLTCVAVDEWHELLGSKRGVQVELVLAHLKTITGWDTLCVSAGAEMGGHAQRVPTRDNLRVWGISATIGNLEEALLVLLGEGHDGVLIRAKEQKEISVHTVLPDVVERLPWAGHLGMRLIDKVLPIIKASNSTLLFTNVRSHSERWYQALLDAAPELAGQMALHHSAVDAEMRAWIEEQLHCGSLQVVVCTSSLDLGVDFRPVDTVIQVGSPKGIARFLQRAGRAGHSPGEVSNIHFVPTHSLEIVEAAALKEAYKRGTVENRTPIMLAYDVLVQYAVTRACGEGFKADELFEEVRTTHCFADLERDEWNWILHFITGGGDTLSGYEEYHRVGIVDGVYRIVDRRTAVRHRMHIGTIVGNTSMRVKFLGGGFVGTIEEGFISRLKPGDVFVLAGRKLELVNVKDMDAIVRRSHAKNAIVPSWLGGRLSLSADMGSVLRDTFNEAADGVAGNELLRFLEPLFSMQRSRSMIPGAGETLVEMINTQDGHHLFVYPFEGRLVHQAMAALLAYRIARQAPITFSIAMNDYGFELVSESEIPISEEQIAELFSTDQLYSDLQRSINNAELGRRKFRDIAVIAGLIFQGMPGAYKKQRHLQASSGMIYDVLQESEPDNLLLQQAYNEVLNQEIELERLHAALERVGQGRIVISKPKDLTPFCFPIVVDSLREQISSEKLEDRIKRMQE